MFDVERIFCHFTLTLQRIERRKKNVRFDQTLFISCETFSFLYKNPVFFLIPFLVSFDCVRFFFCSIRQCAKWLRCIRAAELQPATSEMNLIIKKVSKNWRVIGDNLKYEMRIENIIRYMITFVSSPLTM